jgi:hypothetical protein
MNRIAGMETKKCWGKGLLGLSNERESRVACFLSTYIAIACFFVYVLQAPPNIIRSSYELNVQASGGTSFFCSSTIGVATKSTSCFIQTDKATYKPGQKGRPLSFLAIILD